MHLTNFHPKKKKLFTVKMVANPNFGVADKAGKNRAFVSYLQEGKKGKNEEKGKKERGERREGGKKGKTMSKKRLK